MMEQLFISAAAVKSSTCWSDLWTDAVKTLSVLQGPVPSVSLRPRQDLTT